ncbi:hypothetical protein PPTG_24547 [Phytophthora nicotianae INRA-310]|uniref:Uncharacterized protein n=1 Tax=Phytophthora nicotianae (strain INRA-310) TaxID=761204 RepID=W2PFP6_PHYN3|nr:hypothetical protein PPTG_24547 [Phytophthora nicotianae INRA-310]ETM98814.1 hypothetical protein PPTG_24547 [Phytophthora nicotianae INRA-310]
MARRNQNIDPSGRRHMASGNSYDYLMGADARAAGDQLSGEEDSDALDATCHFDGIRRIWRAADAIQILSLARRILQGRCETCAVALLWVSVTCSKRNGLHVGQWA